MRAVNATTGTVDIVIVIIITAADTVRIARNRAIETVMLETGLCPDLSHLRGTDGVGIGPRQGIGLHMGTNPPVVFGTENDRVQSHATGIEGAVIDRVLNRRGTDIGGTAIGESTTTSTDMIF